MKKIFTTCLCLVGAMLLTSCSAVLGPCVKYNSADFDTVIVNIKADSTIIQEPNRIGNSANPIKDRIIEEAVSKLTDEIASGNLKLKVKVNEPCSPSALYAEGDLLLLEHNRRNYEGVMRVTLINCATQKKITDRKYKAGNHDLLETSLELGRDLARYTVGTLTACQQRAPRSAE